MEVRIIIVIFVLVVESLSEDKHNEEWNLFMNKYKKTYVYEEEYSRRLIWEENLKYIQNHNIRYNLGQYSYFLGINQFSDMTNEEFRAKYLQFMKPSKRNNTVKFMSPLNMPKLPKSVNWVNKGYVTPVKDQAQCGSCWAFSTTGSLEGQYFRKKRNLVSFSEQQLVDCSISFGNNGCNGGLMDNAFKYIQQYGSQREKDYPYTAQDGNCQYNASEVVTKVSGFVDIDGGHEEDLAAAVATQGPVSVAIDASHRSFQLYKGGIYDEPQCSSSALDHGVLVVGYGFQMKKKYWLVKNSWGKVWGMQGYIRMAKDKENQCGIASMASYPTI